MAAGGASARQADDILALLIPGEHGVSYFEHEQPFAEHAESYYAEAKEDYSNIQYYVWVRHSIIYMVLILLLFPVAYTFLTMLRRLHKQRLDERERRRQALSSARDNAVPTNLRPRCPPEAEQQKDRKSLFPPRRHVFIHSRLVSVEEQLAQPYIVPSEAVQDVLERQDEARSWLPFLLTTVVLDIALVWLFVVVLSVVVAAPKLRLHWAFDWIDRGLLGAFWANTMWATSVCLYVLAPFAYLYFEADGVGGNSGLGARCLETAAVLMLFALLVHGSFTMLHALLFMPNGDALSRALSIEGMFAYSAISNAGPHAPGLLFFLLYSHDGLLSLGRAALRLRKAPPDAEALARRVDVARASLHTAKARLDENDRAEAAARREEVRMERTGLDGGAASVGVFRCRSGAWVGGRQFGDPRWHVEHRGRIRGQKHHTLSGRPVLDSQDRARLACHVQLLAWELSELEAKLSLAEGMHRWPYGRAVAFVVCLCATASLGGAIVWRILRREVVAVGQHVMDMDIPLLPSPEHLHWGWTVLAMVTDAAVIAFFFAAATLGVYGSSLLRRFSPFPLLLGSGQPVDVGPSAEGAPERQGSTTQFLVINAAVLLVLTSTLPIAAWLLGLSAFALPSVYPAAHAIDEAGAAAHAFSLAFLTILGWRAADLLPFCREPMQQQTHVGDRGRAQKRPRRTSMFTPLPRSDNAEGGPFRSSVDASGSLGGVCEGQADDEEDRGNSGGVRFLRRYGWRSLCCCLRLFRRCGGLAMPYVLLALWKLLVQCARAIPRWEEESSPQTLPEENINASRIPAVENGTVGGGAPDNNVDSPAGVGNVAEVATAQTAAELNCQHEGLQHGEDEADSQVTTPPLANVEDVSASESVLAETVGSLGRDSEGCACKDGSSGPHYVNKEVGNPDAGPLESCAAAQRCDSAVAPNGESPCTTANGTTASLARGKDAKELSDPHAGNESEHMPTEVQPTHKKKKRRRKRKRKLHLLGHKK